MISAFFSRFQYPVYEFLPIRLRHWPGKENIRIFPKDPVFNKLFHKSGIHKNGNLSLLFRLIERLRICGIVLYDCLISWQIRIHITAD